METVSGRVQFNKIKWKSEDGDGDGEDISGHSKV